MRKAAIAIALALLAAGAACKCPASARQAASEIEDTHRIVLPAYKGYVAKDAALSADEKDRRTKLAESLERLTSRLKDALKD